MKFVQNSLITKLIYDATCAFTLEKNHSAAMFVERGSSGRTGWWSTRTRTRRRRRTWRGDWCDSRRSTCTGLAPVTTYDHVPQQTRVHRKQIVVTSRVLNLSEESLVKEENILILLTSQHTQVISDSCHKHNNICRVTQAILTWLITLETQWLCRSFGKFCKFLEFSFFSLEKNQI